MTTEDEMRFLGQLMPQRRSAAGWSVEGDFYVVTVAYGSREAANLVCVALNAGERWFAEVPLPIEVGGGVLRYDKGQREYVLSHRHGESRQRVPFIFAKTVDDAYRIADFARNVAASIQEES